MSTPPPYEDSPDAVYVLLQLQGGVPITVAAARNRFGVPGLLRHIADTWAQRFPDLQLHADDCGCQVCAEAGTEP